MSGYATDCFKTKSVCFVCRGYIAVCVAAFARSILQQPSLLVTPGSPPDEIPDPFGPGGDVRSATYNETIKTSRDIYCPPTPTGASLWTVGEPPPASPALPLSLHRTPVINNRRISSNSPCGGLKFDTPDRGEVEENGLDAHPEAPVLGRGAFGTVVLGKRRGQ